MPKERTFTVGNRRRRLELFEELAAVRPLTPAARGRVAEGAYGPAANLAGSLSGPFAELAAADAEAFRAAGWCFVRAEPGQWEKLAKEPDLRLGRVFRDEVGHLVLGVGHMTVKLRADLSENEVRDTFCRAHVEVVRKLRFAPNLFEVRVPKAADELEAVDHLQGEVGVEFAEPQMLEHVERREQPVASSNAEGSR